MILFLSANQKSLSKIKGIGKTNQAVNSEI